MADDNSRPTGRVIAEGLGFTEGPTITQDGTVVVTSLTHACLYSIQDGEVLILAETEAAANGATEGPDGCLYVAHYKGLEPPRPEIRSTGGVLRVQRDGAWEWITRDPVSPNDLCFGPDGYLYVTDPTRPRRQDGRIWRIDIETGWSELLVSVPWHPNGIGFGPDDDRLLVASTHSREMVAFPFTPGKPLGEPELFCRIPSAKPDGFAFDVDGNVLVACPALEPTDTSYIHIFDPDGRHLEAYSPLPSNRLSNVALGRDGQLIVTDVEHSSVIAVDSWPAPGLPLHPYR
jgi:gluconolactonase